MEAASVYHEAAKQRVGADDFGDPSYREALDRLLHALNHEARLNAAGEATMAALVTEFLSMRLRLEDWFARHPETGDHAIAAPLIGLGLPRTGSSALACMLAEDKATRPLWTWESNNPFPPPDPQATEPDPRIAQTDAMMTRRAERHPRLTVMLPSATHAPIECQSFMAYDFQSQLFQAMVHVPSYNRWLQQEADLVPTYRMLKRLLQVLQYHAPAKRWRLKNPSHSIWIDALDQVFPDARFVMTHRAPASVIASVADLYTEYRQDLTDHLDCRAIGPEMIEVWDVAMHRMIAFRDAGNEARFFDIRFDRFQADPIPEVQKLYDFLGEELTEETKAAMLAWRSANSTQVGQYQRTPPEVFGVDLDQLSKHFQFYTDRFASKEPA